MENLRYIRDSDGEETAVVEDRIRYQFRETDEGGTLFRSVRKTEGWGPYVRRSRKYASRQAFHDHMIEWAKHFEDVRMLDRRFDNGLTWVNHDVAINRLVYGHGVALYSLFERQTEPGFGLDEETNMRVPDEGRRPDGWYPLKIEGCKVASFLPELFTDYEVQESRRQLEKHHPHLAAHIVDAGGLPLA